MNIKLPFLAFFLPLFSNNVNPELTKPVRHDTGRQGELTKIWCNSTDKYLHSWSLRYDKGPLISKLPKLPRSSESGIELYLEKFDDKLRVQCSIDSGDILSDTTLSVTSTNEILPIFNYTRSDKIDFECEEYTTEYAYVGVVDPFNMISTHQPPYRNTFSLADNGTILCCVYYWTNNNIIRRHVTNKTVLVYNQYFEPNDTPKESRSVYNILYIAAGIACTLLVFIMLAKKYRIKKSSTQQQLESETCLSTERVLYAELDNLRVNSNRIMFSNATPYAEIIGCLHPENKK